MHLLGQALWGLTPVSPVCYHGCVSERSGGSARVAQLESDTDKGQSQILTLTSEHQTAGPSESPAVLGGFSAAPGRGPLGTETLPLPALFGLASVWGAIGRGRLTCISGFGSVAALCRRVGGLRQAAVTVGTGLGPTLTPKERGNAWGPLLGPLRAMS